MTLRRLGALAAASTVLLGAPVKPDVSIKIRNEVVPPGGTVQVKVFVTEPKPISGGKTWMDLGDEIADIFGIALHSPGGDALGVAVRHAGGLEIRCLSPAVGLGTGEDYPVLTIAAGVRADVRRGTQIPLALDPAATWWLDPYGRAYPLDINQGTLAIGGSVNIHNVVPGGGLAPAGSVVRIDGLGFQPGAKVQAEGLLVSSVDVVNPQRIDLVLAADIDLRGLRVRVTNPDGSSATYYSYPRSATVGSSGQPLLARAIPIFPARTVSSAVFPLANGAGIFTGLALENPHATPAEVTVEFYSVSQGRVASATFALAGRSKMWREVGELAGQPVAAQWMRVVASSPLEMLGLVGDESTGVLLPMPPVNGQ